MSAPEKNYKDTILLPETGFPMRGDLTKNEPVRLKKWEDTGLYERILSRRMAQGAPRFLLHDGPPFANGDVHMGTALNKILKDLVLKSKTMAGYAAPIFRAGTATASPSNSRWFRRPVTWMRRKSADAVRNSPKASLTFSALPSAAWACSATGRIPT